MHIIHEGYFCCLIMHYKNFIVYKNVDFKSVDLPHVFLFYKEQNKTSTQDLKCKMILNASSRSTQKMVTSLNKHQILDKKWIWLISEKKKKDDKYITLIFFQVPVAKFPIQINVFNWLKCGLNFKYIAQLPLLFWFLWKCMHKSHNDRLHYIYQTIPLIFAI